MSDKGKKGDEVNEIIKTGPKKKFTPDLFLAINILTPHPSSHELPSPPPPPPPQPPLLSHQKSPQPLPPLPVPPRPLSSHSLPVLVPPRPLSSHALPTLPPEPSPSPPQPPSTHPLPVPPTNPQPAPIQSNTMELQLLKSQSPQLLSAPFLQVEPSGTVAGGIPLPTVGIPNGLEYLAELDHILFVNQSIDISDEVVGLFQVSNWHLMNSQGQRIYIAAEQRYERKFCCPSAESRPFNVSILDQSGLTVLKITRPVTCGLLWWGGDSCGSIVSVFDGDDNLLGYIKQKINPCVTTYEIYNSLNHKIINIRSNKCKYWYTNEKNEFEIYILQPTSTLKSTLKDNKILLGKIKKNWAGFSEFTSADTFGIQFPIEMEIPTKALLIGAVFLIDFQFLEARNGKCTGCCLLLQFLALVIFIFMVIIVVMYFTRRAR